MKFILSKPDIKLYDPKTKLCIVTDLTLRRYQGKFKRYGYLNYEDITELDALLFSAGWMRNYRWTHKVDGISAYRTYVTPL